MKQYLYSKLFEKTKKYNHTISFFEKQNDFDNYFTKSPVPCSKRISDSSIDQDKKKDDDYSNKIQNDYTSMQK